jgi:hypothetical protein
MDGRMMFPSPILWLRYYHMSVAAQARSQSASRAHNWVGKTRRLG